MHNSMYVNNAGGYHNQRAGGYQPQPMQVGAGAAAMGAGAGAMGAGAGAVGGAYGGKSEKETLVEKLEAKGKTE